MIRRLVFLVALLIAAPTWAQQKPPVLQSGSVTPRHGAIWTTNGVIQDAGRAAGGPITNGAYPGYSEIGITNTGLPFCINSAPITAPFKRVCLGSDVNGNAVFDYEAFGGAHTGNLVFQIGNSSYNFPVTLSGILGPNLSTIGDISAFNNTSGSLLEDTGVNISQVQTVLHPIGGGSDDAPQIIAAVTNGANVVFAAGSYTLCSTQSSPYPSGYGPPAVLIQSKSNFAIDFGSAQFTACNSISGNSSGLEYFMFDKDTNFSVTGGTFVGNMTGKTGSALTCGMALTNNVGLFFQDQAFTGDWESLGGGGEPFCGDYDVAGVVSGTIGNSVSNCFDMAFQLNMSFVEFNCTGEFHGSFGSVGFSEIYDVNNAGINTTGYSIPDSLNVTVRGNASGFATGWAIFSGSGYIIDGNYYNNIGGSTQSAWGGIIGYNAGGPASSVGHPPSDFQIHGHYETNGNGTVTGGGLLIESGNIANSDVISHIRADIICNNNVNVCFSASSSSHLSDLAAKTTCYGSSQTTCLDASTSSLINPSVIVGSGSAVSLVSNTITNITSLALPGGIWEVSGTYGTVTSVGSAASSGAIWTVSGAFPSAGGTPGYMIFPVSLGAQTTAFNLAPATENLGANGGTIYLNVSCTFSSGTCGGFGSLKATRQ